MEEGKGEGVCAWGLEEGEGENRGWGEEEWMNGDEAWGEVVAKGKEKERRKRWTDGMTRGRMAVVGLVRDNENGDNLFGIA
ncbi:hypothetical protein GOBAR_DD09963 [Gossypium barbadense]|nr:hypothetical protein GOBAR_DD09963 [Gossypium barbadense]